jgi:hypothetical protein
LTTILRILFVPTSDAVTVRVLDPSISNLTSIYGTPLESGLSLSRVNSPKKRLSLVNS